MTTLVLLPGMDGTGLLFGDLVSSLPSSLRPEIVSYPVDRPMGYEELREFVAERLPAQPFILVGESFSGPVAVALAAENRTTIRGLVLVGSFVRSPIPIPNWLLSPCVRFPLWRIPVSVAAGMLLGRWSSAILRSRLAEAMAAVRPDVWEARLRAALSVDFADRLRSVKIPLLYLRGRFDRIVPKAAWTAIKEILPSARLVELEGPHFLLQALPREAAHHLGAFAEQIEVV